MKKILFVVLVLVVGFLAVLGLIFLIIFSLDKINLDAQKSNLILMCIQALTVLVPIVVAIVSYNKNIRENSQSNQGVIKFIEKRMNDYNYNSKIVIENDDEIKQEILLYLNAVPIAKTSDIAEHLQKEEDIVLNLLNDLFKEDKIIKRSFMKKEISWSINKMRY